MQLEAYLRTRAELATRAREQAQRLSTFADDPSMVIGREVEILRAPLETTISYTDAEGRPSTRTIQIRRFDGYYVRAYCLMRREQRTFIIDRIQAAYDSDGVEIADFPMFLDIHFGEDNLVAEARERQKYWRFVEQTAAPELLLLRLVAAADGHLAPQEQLVIGDHALSLVSRRDRPDERDDLVRYARRLSGTAQTVDLAMKYLQSKPKAHRRRFGETCLAIVEADGHVLDSEIDMLRVLEDGGLFR